MRDSLYVEPSGGDVRGDEQRCRLLLEAAQRALALRLRAVAVEGGSGDTRLQLVDGGGDLVAPARAEEGHSCRATGGGGGGEKKKESRQQPDARRRTLPCARRRRWSVESSRPTLRPACAPAQ